MPLLGLQPFQTELEPETLYAAAVVGMTNLNRSMQADVQLRPNIEIGVNAADVYGSQVLPDSPPTNMTKMLDAITGIRAFDYVPNYIYIDPVSTAPETIIISGVQTEEVV